MHVRVIQVKYPFYYIQGMDISDIEIVIVNGPPATLAQLYQVFHSI